jgi:iron(III) transport system substrate-binding protein
MKNSLLLMTLMVIFSMQAKAKELVIYSVYPGETLEAIFKPFTASTGISIRVVEGKSNELIERIINEGESTEADLHLDKDLVFHGLATRKGIYRPFQSDIIENTIPAQFIETNKNWVTLFYRSRVIMFNKNKVDPSEIPTYESLMDSKWQNRLCMRTSKSNYNQALSAYLFAHFGAEKAREILKGWVANLAQPVFTSDRAVIGAVAEGKCDIGIANSYYLIPFHEKDPTYPVHMVFPNQNTTKAHVNGVGIGMVKTTKNAAEATKLMEYMLSKEVQAPVAAAFDQYPVNPNAQVGGLLNSFGTFSSDTTNVGVISNLTEIATELMNEVQYP